MTNWTAYAAFIATAISIVGLSRLAIQGHLKETPRTLSELAAAEQVLLVRFRNILIVCGLLFGVTVFGFLTPHSANAPLIALFGSLMIGGELLASLIPDRNKTKFIHAAMAQIMAVGMLGLAFLFWFGTKGTYYWIEMSLAILMCGLGALTWFDKKNYIFYELGFIFCSHFTILIAVIALS